MVTIKFEGSEIAGRKFENLVRTVLREGTWAEVDAISMMRFLSNDFGILVDWHECGYALDILRSKGWIEVKGHTNDGMTIYRVLPPNSRP